MKRYHYGTWAQMMETIRKSEYMNKKFNDSGYDYYEVHKTTVDELTEMESGEMGEHYEDHFSKFDKYFCNDNLFTLVLVRT